MDSSQQPPNHMKRTLTRLRFSWCVVMVNVGANFVGFFVVQLLLHYSLPAREWQAVAFIDTKASMLLLSLLMPGAIFVLVLLAAPVSRALRLLENGGEVEDHVLRAARQRVINLPFQAALMNLVAWILPSVTFPALLALRGDLSVSETGLYILYSFTNAFMITLLAFVLLQYACRKTVIPVLFPQGHLRDQKGTLRLGIRARLMILYGAICLIPMLQTVLVFNLGGSAASSQVAPVTVLNNLWTFSTILFVFVAVYGLWLASLFSRNMSEPIEEIMELTKRVQAGDYEARAQVVSNDEIGYLGDRFNEMSRGLTERESIREMFNLFTSPEIGAEILAGKVSTDGEIREVTLLFADLRGFTAMSERLEPKQVVESVNSYFSAMSEAIVESGGIILQYVGDEIEAVFGAPVHDPNHADRAVAAALAMRKRLEQLNRERESLGRDLLRHGIGVHTGQALAGIVGSKYKISYAMVGDTVNMASRIQDLNKEMNSDILISEETYQSLTNPVQVAGPVSVSVRGKRQSLDVYRLL
jgi:adenylate cyclase